ncbi:hypothetical protein ACN42_g1775 [Penicillium freii]|uniref:NACHT domain-containing protein n=1 Tax=Penicillium freii TaxID=48697 RepID=A0A117NRC1_PENFR|nr:hypothetical protein ACN42_g1775 [Penicillium freii]
MSSTSNAFGNKNSGTQVGINHGQIYYSSAPQQSPPQSIDNEVLRSLAFPEMLDRRDNIEPCYPDTCQWILELEKYKSWRSQSRGLLWIKGKPGAGKSTLMLFLHDKLKRDVDGGIRLEFFFTARGTEMQRTPLGMLRSLLSQIFDRDATVRSQVSKAYEERCRPFGYSERGWEWPRVVLEELLAGTILASASRQHIMIFVDALDEAGAESAQHLAAYFHRLINRAEKLNVAVQICISCRHYPIMESDPAREICVERHNHDDIARYIKDIIVDTEVKDGPGQETREALAEQLIWQCNGVFQWAHLIMPLIRQKILEGESFDDIRCWLREVPIGLEDVYTYILNNVIEGRNRVQSFLLFQWVSLAERPLTVKELRYALAAQNTDLAFLPKTWEKIDGFVESNGRMKRKIQALSGGLAEVISTWGYHETVQVVHQSVNDFLRAKGLGLLCRNIGTSTLPMDGVKILFQCQATLYRTCLVYLATVHIPRKVLGEQGFIQDYPLLAYATNNLFIHAEKAAGSRADVLENEQDILQRVIGPWVQIYQTQNPSSDRCPREGTTILHMAAAANLVDVIESVVSNGGDITKKDIIGDTAFHLAARQGHITAGKILREKGADHEAKNEDGITPLTEAARCGHARSVEWLLHGGAKIETSARSEGALQAASLQGYQRVVAILLGARADVNAQGGKYGNALQAACAADKGNTEIVQLLLEAHADVNAQGGHYANALQAGVYKGNTEIVQLLLEAHADVNAQGGHYGNALQAVAYEGNTEIVQLLLEAHADVNAQGGYYASPLLAAVYDDDADPAQLLLHAGADVLLANELGQTPLHIAALKDRLELLNRFPLLASATNHRDKFLRTPLHLAICLGHTEFAEKLLHLGADPSLPDGYGRNILDWVVGNESLMHQIQNHCPPLVVTPKETQELTVRQSILQISDTILRSKLDSSWPLLPQIGRYFLFLDDVDNARYIFQLHLSHEDSAPTSIHYIACGFCPIEITGSYIVCRVCAYLNVCSSCVQKHPYHSRLHPNQEHKTFEVLDVTDNESRLTSSESEQLSHFLSNIVHELSAPNTDITEAEPPNDSVSYPAPKKTALVSRAILSGGTLSFALFFGLLAVLLRYWFF